MQIMLLNKGCANYKLFLSHLQSFSECSNSYYKPVPCSGPQASAVSWRKLGLSFQPSQVGGASGARRWHSPGKSWEMRAYLNVNLEMALPTFLHTHPWLSLYLLDLWSFLHPIAIATFKGPQLLLPRSTLPLMTIITSFFWCHLFLY